MIKYSINSRDRVYGRPGSVCVCVSLVDLGPGNALRLVLPLPLALRALSGGSTSLRDGMPEAPTGGAELSLYPPTWDNGCGESRERLESWMKFMQPPPPPSVLQI